MAALTVTLAFGVLARGAYFPGGRAVFVALAGLTLGAAVIRAPAAAGEAVRSPAVVLLGAIALLSGVSAAWTLAPPDAALRAGLVIAGYGAMAIAAAILARDLGSGAWIAAAIAAVATASGVLGLLGVALREEPWAEYIGGSWRAGGTVEYPPALALLQVSALPALLVAMVRQRLHLALPAAAAAALAGGVLALSVSRFQLALAALVLGLALLWPTRTLGCSRGLAAAAVAVVLGGGAVAYAAAGGAVPPQDTGGEGARLAFLGATPVAAALVWLLIHRVTGRLAAPTSPTAGPGRRPAAAIGALGCIAAVAFLVTTVRPVEGRTVERLGGFSHGRIEIWRAAIETAWDRPLVGTGAEGFLAGSAANQRRRTPTRYAHSLPLEGGAELGLVGLLLALGLYAASGVVLWRARPSPALWLLGPAAAGFLLANLLDWPWHIPGAGAVWAAALGGLICAGSAPPSAPARPTLGS